MRCSILRLIALAAVATGLAIALASFLGPQGEAEGSRRASTNAGEGWAKCGTPAILERLAKREKLSLEAKAAQLSVSLRPTDPGGGYYGLQHLLPTLYDTEHFVIHYTTGSDGGAAADAPNLADGNTNGVPDYVEDFASYFEASYTFQVGTRGFSPPPDDAGQPPNDGNNRNPDGRYDVFVYNLDELYGYADSEDWPNTPSRGFIGVNNDYAWVEPNEDVEGKIKGAMKVTAAHELHHAIQNTYDVNEEWWWTETTATYMEDEVYPAVNDNYGYLWPWFDATDSQGLETESPETSDEAHENGNFIWAKRLTEDFGDDVIREIWVEDQTADGLAAIDNVLQTHGSTLVEEFKEFATANFFLEDSYVDGADYRSAVTGNTTYDGVWLEFEYDAASHGLPFTIDAGNVNRDTKIDAWATDYVTLSLDPSFSQYRVFFDGLDSTVAYEVKLVAKKGVDIDEYELTLDAQKDGWVDLPYDAYDEVVLIIMNAGDTAPSNPLWRVVINQAETPTATPTPTVTPSPILMPMAPGWNDKCYVGDQMSVEDALADISDKVLAVYILNKAQAFDRWFPGRADVSTIDTLNPYDQLFVLMSEAGSWQQEQSTQTQPSVDLMRGWNSVCYAGQTKPVENATAGIADAIGILYRLLDTQAWVRYVPNRPDVSNISTLTELDSVFVLVTREGGIQWTFTATPAPTPTGTPTPTPTPTPQALTMVASPSEGGTTSPPPGTHWYAYGITVPVSAIAYFGWTLDYWSADCSGEDPDTFVDMDGDKTCIANFACGPVVPGTYTGDVWLWGEPAPDDTIISVWIDEVLWSGCYTDGGQYVCEVPDYFPEEPPCFEGGWIEFYADDVPCDPVSEWDSGLHEVDLDCWF
ncbi:MAG: hypothetical protein JSU97_10055 [Dehalococcoidia bacterium]|nr:MAG: hypothetical protein JSU97_10055 [Dehalococcoidia bacterium]